MHGSIDLFDAYLVGRRLDLTLIDERRFGNGVVALRYELSG
jgi:hypothetical protein